MKTKRLWLCLPQITSFAFGFALCGLGLQTAIAQSPQYTIIDLGLLPGGSASSGVSVNDAGQVTGNANDSSGSSHAFFYPNPDHPGTMLDLGTFGGLISYGAAINAAGKVTGGADSNSETLGFLYPNPTPAPDVKFNIGSLGGANTVPSDINDAGQITGSSDTSTSGVTHAFLYQPSGLMQDLGILSDGTYSTGTALNAIGQVVGISQTSTSVILGFLYPNPGGGGAMLDIQSLGGDNTYPRDINNAAMITGMSETTTQSFHAFCYQFPGPMQDLGTLGGDTSEGNAINASGQITGKADLSALSVSHAFLSNPDNPTHLIDLGTFGGDVSAGYSINDAGQITGSASLNIVLSHAFLYQNGTLFDLNLLDINHPGGNPNFILNQGNKISQSGLITGYATFIDGSTLTSHAFLAIPVLTPTPTPSPTTTPNPTPSPIPTPSPVPSPTPTPTNLSSVGVVAHGKHFILTRAGGDLSQELVVLYKLKAKPLRDSNVVFTFDAHVRFKAGQNTKKIRLRKLKELVAKTGIGFKVILRLLPSPTASTAIVTSKIHKAYVIDPAAARAVLILPSVIIPIPTICSPFLPTFSLKNFH